MLTTAMLLGLAWKSLVVAALTLGLLRLARTRSAGERSMTAVNALPMPTNMPVMAMSRSPDRASASTAAM